MEKYSAQVRLRVRTGVQGNALKYTSKFSNKFFVIFPVLVLWKCVINISVAASGPAEPHERRGDTSCPHPPSAWGQNAILFSAFYMDD